MPALPVLCTIAGVEAVGSEPLWVDDAASLRRVCEQAGRTRRVAVDTEADSFHSYFHKLCLVQLAFDGASVVVDPLAIGREGMAPFVALCADAEVEKIFHGADYDLRVMNRDLGLRVVGLTDTQLAAQLLGEPQTGLAAMVHKELGVVLGKEFQRADFSARPLAPELRRYAGADTIHLIALSDRLRERLAGLGRLEWWREDCRAMEEVEWTDNSATAPYERIRGASKVKGAARDRLAALAGWREKRAASLDIPPFRVMRNEVLLDLAKNPPADLAALAQRPGVGRGTVRQCGGELLSLLEHPPAAPPRVVKARPVLDPERERRVKELRHARDMVAAALGMSGAVLAPRAALEAVVDRHAADAAALQSCLGRKWRAEVLGPVLLPLLQGWPRPRAGGDASTV